MTALPFLCPEDRTVLGEDGSAFTVLCPSCDREFSRDYAPRGVELSAYLSSRFVRLSTKSPISRSEQGLEGLSSLYRHGIRTEERAAFTEYVEKRLRKRTIPVGSTTVAVRVPVDRLVFDGEIYVEGDLSSVASAYALDVEEYTEVGIPVDVALAHAFLGTPVAVAAFFEGRYRGEPKGVGFVPATKAESLLVGHNGASRYISLRLPELWSRFLHEPDLVTVVDRVREDYPGVLRPSSLSQFARLGVTERDALTWYRGAKTRWDGSYRSEGFGNAGLAEVAQSYATGGFTPEDGVRFGFYTDAGNARLWHAVGFEEYDDTVPWRELLVRFSVEYGEDEAFARIEKLRSEGVPPEWATSFEDAKVVD